MTSVPKNHEEFEPPLSLGRLPATSSDTENEIFEYEADLEKSAVSWARKRGWYSRKYRAAGRRASPDRIFILRGKVVFIEFKRAPAEPTDQQWEEIRSLLDAGADAIWLDSIEDFRACLVTRERS
jgi:hypothetical protein